MTDRHLTDEQLSSYLDGVPADSAGTGTGGADVFADRRVGSGPPPGEHLARCAACRLRMADLEAAREFVRTPVPPPAPDVRAASIATVLRRAEGAHASPHAHEEIAADADATPVDRSGISPIAIRTGRRLGVLVGAAAAVLVLAVAIGVPLALSSRDSSVGSAASAPANSAATHQRLSQHESFSGSLSATDGISDYAASAIANLGTLDSVNALRSRVAVLSSTGVGGTKSASSAPSSPVSGQSPSTGASSTGTIDLFERCFASAENAAGPGRPVQLLATAEYKGTPSLVFAFFSVSGGSATGRAAHSVAVVTARNGCRVLGTTSL
jgi:hypothetical protein